MSRPVSLIVPTYNMAAHLAGLFESLRASGIAGVVSEVIFVNDGSIDSTSSEIERLRATHADLGAKSRELRLSPNRGRFEARKQGAEAAQFAELLFLDSRITLPPDFGASFEVLSVKYPSIVGSVDIDTSRNRFCLYWERSHRAIFRHHYRHADRPITLTESNYDEFLKGTTVFSCPREVFLNACRLFDGKTVLNDDTLLLKEIVKHVPITIHPDLRIQWVPREDWRAFLLRLWERGPSFVEYHVLERRGVFFWVTIMGCLGTLAWLASLFLDPALGLTAFVVGVLLAWLSTLLITRSLSEFFRIAPLHVAVILTFGVGILRGVWVALTGSAGKKG